MRKKKIDFKKYANMHEDKEITGKDGMVITVRDHIPYADKIEMVRNIIENYLMIHDDSRCYESHEIHAARIKAILKYYTDVPVDEADADAVADFAINNEVIGQIMEYIHDDYFEAENIYVTLIRSVAENYADDRSIAKAIRRSFSFLFTGEDITESMAKAELTKDTLFKAFDALREKEHREETTVNNGTMKVGDNIINFAKKE